MSRTSSKQITAAGGRDDANSLLFKLALVVTFLMLGVRLSAASSLGLSDMEALFLTYGGDVRGLYETGPGFMAWLASMMPSSQGVVLPQAVHFLTAVLATAVPWLGGWTAKALGADSADALVVVIALVALPVVSVSLFLFTPALPLAVFWMLSMALGLHGERYEPGSVRAFVFTVGAAVATALAVVTDPVGLALVLAYVVLWTSPSYRPRWKTFEPYAGVLVALAFTLPVWSRGGDSNVRAWFSMSQLATGEFWTSVELGQLLSVGPLVTLLLAWALARGRCEWRGDAKVRFSCAAALTGLLLDLFVVRNGWEGSAVRWMPVYLVMTPLMPRLIDSESMPRWPSFAAVGTSLALSVTWFGAALSARTATFLIDRAPAIARVVDVFHVWRSPGAVLREQVMQARLSGLNDIVVVGQAIGTCAQAKAAMGNLVPVGCRAKRSERGWLPRSRWDDVQLIIFVSEQSQGEPFDTARQFPGRTIQQVRRINVRWRRRVIRRIRLEQLGRMGAG